MSIQSKFRERLAPAEQIQGERPVPSDSSVSFLLKATKGVQLISVARCLVQYGASPKSAKQTIDRLATLKDTTLDLPIGPETLNAAQQALQDLGVQADIIEPVLEKDVAMLRARLKMTRADFSRRFGIDERTLESWEQHRSSPDRTARTLLHLIDKEPDLVTAALLAPKSHNAS